MITAMGQAVKNLGKLRQQKLLLFAFVEHKYIYNIYIIYIQRNTKHSSNDINTMLTSQ